MKNSTLCILILFIFNLVQAETTANEIENLFEDTKNKAIEAQKDASESIRQSTLAKSTYDKGLIEKHIAEAENNLITAKENAKQASDQLARIKAEYTMNNEAFKKATTSISAVIENIQSAGTFNKDQIAREQENFKNATRSFGQVSLLLKKLEPVKINELSALSESANIEIEKAVKALESAKIHESGELSTDTLTGFGFGPALFLVNYDQEILSDANDIRIRQNNTIGISGNRKESYLGLELHYGFSFWTKCRNGFSKKKPPCNDKNKWTASSGHTFTPYLGLFDLEDGFNGYSLGVLYGFWRGDNEFSGKKALNFGIGRFVHKNRLVATRGITDGGDAVTDFEISDYSHKKDVYGLSLMISAEIGF